MNAAYSKSIHPLDRAAVAVAFAVIALSSGLVRAEAPLWRNDWLVPAYPSLFGYTGDLSRRSSGTPVPVVFSSNGDVLLRTPAASFLDDEFVRIGATGAVQWRSNLGSLESASYDGTGQATIAYPDGSAIVSIQYGTAIAKIDAVGQPTWSVAVPADHLIATPYGLFALACNALSNVDPASGKILWQHTFPCSFATGLAVSPAGDVYASFEPQTVYNEWTVEVDRFDTSGKRYWTIRQAVANDSGLAVAGATDAMVYLTDGYQYSNAKQTQALNKQDGSLAWRADGHVFIGFAQAPSEPVLVSVNDTERVSATDGSPRWIQPTVTGTYLTSVDADRLMVDGTLLDAASGAVRWSIPAATVDGAGNSANYFAFGVTGDGSILGVAAALSSPAPVVLQRFDPQTGTALERFSLPQSPQGVNVSKTVADTQRVVSVTNLSSPNGAQVRVRAVAVDDGRNLWETTDESPAGEAASSAWLVLAGDAVVVGTVTNSRVWIAAYDAATGVKRWDQFFIGPYLPQAPAYMASLLADAAGNPIVSITLGADCPPGQTSPPCSQLTIGKLDRTDGHVLWRRDDLLPYYSYPRDLFLSGDHLLVNHPFAAPDQSTVLMDVSSTDGSVLWRSADSRYAGVEQAVTAADGNLLLSNVGNWGEVDPQSGATVWNNSNTTDCVYYGSVALPNGDIAASGYSGMYGLNKKPCVVVLPHRPGATAATWTLDPPDSISHGQAYFVQADAAGQLWVPIARYFSPVRVVTLAQFDPTRGALVGEQALWAESYDDPLRPWLDTMVIQAPSTDHRLIAPTLSNAPPGAATMGVAMEDVEASAHGDLSLAVHTDRGFAAPGQLLGFHATVSYDGDAPITGVGVIVVSPWKTRAQGITCAAFSADNCTTREKGADLYVSFDIAPGGQVDISGKFPALDARYGETLVALAVGPTALVESDMANNFSDAQVASETIFANGFE